MRQLLSDYRGNHKSIFLVPIGDVHLGNRYYNPAHLEKTLRFIDKNRNRCRIVLMGDILEVATKGSVGRSVYDESYPTWKQFEQAVEVFTPYADLIDAVMEGNHEERIIRDTSYEIVEEFCHRIGRPQAYGKFSSILNINMGSDLTYSAYAWHGSTGSITEAGAFNAMLNMRNRVVAHLYLMGHTHKLFGIPKSIILPSPHQEEAVEMEQLFVNTGSALHYGGYGEQKGFQLNRNGFGAIQLFADSRKMIFHYIDDLVV